MGRYLRSLGVVVLISSLCTGVAYADNDDIAIKYVSVGAVEYTDEPGFIYDVEVKTLGTGYYVEEYEPNKDYDDWEPGKKVTYEIVIRADDGYYFDEDYLTSDIRISNMEVKDQDVDDDKIEIRANYFPKIKLTEPTDLWFDEDEDDGRVIARWEEVDYCERYEVNIYWEEERERYNYSEENYEVYKVQQSKNVYSTKNYLDVSQYVTSDDYTISFKVRAVAPSTDESKYVASSAWVDCNDETSAVSGNNSVYGQFDWTSSQIRFKDMTGEFVSGWQLLSSDWYYFDPENKDYAIMSDWKEINGSWYYFDSNGRMVRGWQSIEGQYYCFHNGGDFDGALQTGWVEDGPDGSWNYLQEVTDDRYPKGAKVFDYTTAEGQYVDSDGRWYAQEGENPVNVGKFHSVGDKIFYRNADGTLASGWKAVYGNYYYFEPSNQNYATTSKWLMLDGYYYYFGSDGVMQTGWLNYNNAWYYLNTTNQSVPFGAMLRDTKTPDGYTVNGDGIMIDNTTGPTIGTNYATQLGLPAGNYSGWIQVKGYWYFFNPAGENKPYVNEWADIGGNWYLFDGYGKMQTGWVFTGTEGSWYYLQEKTDTKYPEGAKVFDYTTPDNYYINKSGIYVSGSSEVETRPATLNPVQESDGNSGNVIVQGETSVGPGAYLDYKARAGVSSEKYSGWTELGGSWYYFNPDNKNIPYVNEWAVINGETYLFDEYGRRRTGWIDSGTPRTWFYLQEVADDRYPVGAKVCDYVTPDNHYVNKDGVYIGV